jgi:hypothetical protein
MEGRGIRSSMPELDVQPARARHKKRETTPGERIADLYARTKQTGRDVPPETRRQL